ncbi:MAG: FAD-binding oxidoreductase [Pseudomonadales bacterium]|nr:FAD-binding oxidoreductase [Pseudomonadales bacterium]
MENYDVIIIGAGMAGISAGYELAESNRVLVLEREDQPGYHSTGRSAAVYASSYGSEKPAVNALTKASGGFFSNPPENFSVQSLQRQRGVLFVAHQDEIGALDKFFQNLKPHNQQLELMSGSDVSKLVPILKPEYCVKGVYDRDVFEIDVHALQEGYLRGMRHQSGTLITNFEVTEMRYQNEQWIISNGNKSYYAPIVVNAAGAWVDELAKIAQVRPVGIQPLRRSAILVDPPEGPAVDNWPMVVDVQENFYFKPDAGKIMVSSANEDISAPCDVQPEELDIAYAAHYAGEATHLNIQRVEHSWAGLRNFVQDRSPVIGFDGEAKGFFWLAGQGGYGIQTAPAAGRLVAKLIQEDLVPDDLGKLGLTKELVSPQRLKGR